MRQFFLAGLLMMGLGGNASATILSAVERGDYQGLEQALAMGSSVDEKNAQGQTALMVAVWKNDIDAARLLLAAGADVNAKDGIQDSPFLVAGAQGRVDILRMILAHGADLTSTNRFGGTALIPAAEKGHPDAVDLLIAAGVNVDHVNRLGWTALLEVAILTDGGPTSQRIVRSLLQAGADVDIKDSDGKNALAHARARDLSAIATLLEASKAND
ncbi:ankyrin repeat domain-containing protein [Agrobacterium tumefaciens]|nr:ankyrin repeat domain-containing protein [Agrobacterium tumefaciens]UXS03202.1 ankyrin repeat domain-containing protein [Agrobacterium tumefaciens]